MIIIPSFTTSLQQDAASTIPIESSLDIGNYPEISLTALNKSWYPWFSRGVNDLCLGGWLNNHDIICHGRAQWCEMVVPVVMKYCTLWSVIRVWVCSRHHISIFAITFWLSLLQTGRGSMIWFLNRKIPADTRKMSLDSTRWPQSEMYHYTSTQAKLMPKKSIKRLAVTPLLNKNIGHTRTNHLLVPRESSTGLPPSAKNSPSGHASIHETCENCPNWTHELPEKYTCELHTKLRISTPNWRNERTQPLDVPPDWVFVDLKIWSPRQPNRAQRRFTRLLGWQQSLVWRS